MAGYQKSKSRYTPVVTATHRAANTTLPLRHLGDTLKVTNYHGQRRETQGTALADADIVLTTYRTLAADSAARRSPVHAISWFRVVLDEGKC